jgi:hypothetical protein
MRELYDLRYFYADNDQIGHYTCGVAFETMMSIFRQHRLDNFHTQEWYSALERSSGNPVIQGFLAEHICLSRIISNGLLAVNKNLTRMSHSSFQEAPSWDQQFSSTHTVRLYIPTIFNFRAVDAVILLVDYDAKTAHMYPIQITLSMRHKDSEEDFYTGIWWKWVAPLEKAGFTVKSTFVWIDKKQPADHVTPEVASNLRSGTKIVRPAEHCSVHIGVGQVDRILGATLGL